MLLDDTPYGALAVYGDRHSQAVSIMKDGRSVATVSADRVEMAGIEGWWINRCLVRKPELRSQGVGTFILQRLKRSISEISTCRVMLVSPGGYSNETDRQVAFYQRNGFAPVEGEPDLFMHVWELEGESG